ncbi:IclR family transcriptional regulator [Knoellia locipacati]|uniref:IclR family transcriptional regulator n=1 Tax=Knoellia locipacati TaxID=882824 RepID=UPI001FE33D1B|nr:IclR family transcriptional regulator [Knoellia locipacati]
MTSVDHALRLATWLQLEGGLTVAEAASRLGVARSTAHRLLAMLVYRDFAVQSADRGYRAGPVLELAGNSPSETSALRAAALGPMQDLVALVGETVNLTIRTGDTARFIASVESPQALRVGSREGMVFPAHRVTGGQILLAELSDGEVEDLYSADRYAGREVERPDVPRLLRTLARIRSRGLAVNRGLSEKGVVAVGRAVRDSEGVAAAGLSISMPAVRYNPEHLPGVDAALIFATGAVTAALTAE